ncbi:MAG: asparagine synthase (glutamine-hydrolyzing) [Lachnospiraceae bacterium]|nr:asparagine synthase (glutamine-hydrolyzing) [Lachnospiraceae bacterium]
MCGIAGFFNAADNYLKKETYYQEILVHMRKSMFHRGPDGCGELLFSKCGLAHSRLSIIDISGGSQPMSRHSCHIVYNGELYNLKELRNDLELRGCHFDTKSDTEVILMGFLEYGPDFVKKLDGIFAFAIYDEKHESLYLFRDSFGVKPLFFMMDQGSVLFASEIKAIFNFPGVKACVGKDGISTILGLGPAREPGNAVFEGVYEVKPGFYIKFSKHGKNEVNYWRLISAPHDDSYEETIEKTRYLVVEAIKRQMISDVPICTFLSGGVDSSIVSSICSSELKKKNQKLTTYSFDFSENKKYFKSNSFQPTEDRPYVEKMVEYLDSDHHYLMCDEITQVELLKESVQAHDLPCMADIDSSLLHFCKEVGTHHKVTLTGECADEVFGGYPWFHREEFLQCNTFPWTRSLEPRKALINQSLLEYLDLDSYVKNAYDQAVSEIDILPWENEVETNRRMIGYLNIRFFMQTLLNRMDRTSMKSGLEARVPFADRDLVSYIFNVPWEMKAKDGQVKNVLRQSAKGLLPDDILFRRKSPYPKTYNPDYETLLVQQLKQEMESDCPLLELIDQEKVVKFMSSVKDYGSPWYGQLMAGPQMIAYLIQINHWLKTYHISINI